MHLATGVHVVTGAGRLVSVSGQVALDEHGEHGEIVGHDDSLTQARQVFANLQRCLSAAGVTFDELVKVNCYVTDVAYLPAIRRARDEVVDTAHPPASTAVQVAALVRPELLMEIEAWAIAAG